MRNKCGGGRTMYFTLMNIEIEILENLSKDEEFCKNKYSEIFIVHDFFQKIRLYFTKFYFFGRTWLYTREKSTL